MGGLRLMTWRACVRGAAGNGAATFAGYATCENATTWFFPSFFAQFGQVA
jgi:viroplasmin and RNaseH domain-containing protein